MIAINNLYVLLFLTISFSFFFTMQSSYKLCGLARKVLRFPSTCSPSLLLTCVCILILYAVKMDDRKKPTTKRETTVTSESWARCL